MKTNPFARLVFARIKYDPKGSVAPGIEAARRAAAAFSRLVEYFQTNHVRVVNMSWGIGLDLIENQLHQKGAQMTPEKRRELAKSILSVYHEGMQRALASAPEIVFVAAAGNSSDDPDFAMGLPQLVRLPNLLVVRALDRSALPTFITNYGPAVKIYAQGQDVEILLPGGSTAMASGVVIGLVGAIAVRRAMRGLLFRVGGSDSVTLLTSAMPLLCSL